MIISREIMIAHVFLFINKEREKLTVGSDQHFASILKG